jgi:hypothetical protein
MIVLSHMLGLSRFFRCTHCILQVRAGVSTQKVFLGLAGGGGQWQGNTWCRGGT